MYTREILLELIVLTLFLSMFVELTSSTQETSTTTVWIKIHRIQAVDQIEKDLGDEADWRYRIWVYTDPLTGNWAIENYTAEPNHDDIIVDKTHRFDNVVTPIITINIDLFDDDPPYYDTADISSSIPETGPGISVSGKRFYIRYDLVSNTFVEGTYGRKDEVIFEGGYYKTSGEFDSRDAIDEYDANLWFTIWDSLGLNAYFTYSPASPTVGEDVQFTDVSPDPEGKLASRLWNFGDGSASNLKNPVHKYEKAGIYTVNLTVTDYEGATGTVSQNIAIKGPSWGSLAIVSIVIAIVIAGVGIVVFRRRKQSK